MKLHEIIDTELSSDFSPGHIIASGGEATVYNDVNDPHMAVRSVHRKRDDSYWKYIEAIVKNKMTGNNPYVPRVYKFDKNKQKFQLEKLVPMHSMDDKELDYIAETIGLIERGPDPWDRAKWAKVSLIVTFIRDAMYKKLETIPEDLQQVLKLILSLKATNSTDDISEDNVMVRRTPYGPQLVITDPL